MSEVVELRQYTLKPGRRDVLIELFEREFIESQEAVGMEILGTFRDADNPNRFVWLRGFPDMERRAKSLADFYGGRVWKAHREAANATMLDSDNVLLLRPAWSGSGFKRDSARSAGVSATPENGIIATIYYLHEAASANFVQMFRNEMPSLLRTRCRGCFLAAYVTEHSPNTFPALPVREDANVFVWCASVADVNAVPVIQLPSALEAALVRTPEILRLLPTQRSRLPGAQNPAQR
jgi:hypothetical protein